MWEESLRAHRALGSPADKVTSREYDLRDFVHDALHPHHDKDVRALAMFPGPSADAQDLSFYVLDYAGKLRCLLVPNDTAQGRRSPPAANVLLHRGHAMALVPLDMQGKPPPTAAKN